MTLLLFFQLEKGERHVLDETIPLKPSYTRTWPVALILWLVHLARGDKEAASDANGNGIEGEDGGDSEVVSDGVSDEPKVKVSSGTAVPAAKTSGRRRKGGKR
jgi:hypothetical protein